MTLIGPPNSVDATATDDSSTSGGTYDLAPALVPAQPADAFGITPPVAPSTAAGSVSPATTATFVPDTVSSSWGETIAELFGTCQVLGLPLWTGDATYIQGTDGTTNLVVDFAVIFGRAGPNGTGASIRNIYFDAVPVISVDSDTGQLSITGDFDYTFYDGTQTGVDPTIDAREAPYTPAFLGMIYLVVHQYVGTGTKFPQVIGEIHLDEVASPTGALIEPIVYSNPLAPLYYTHTARWDYNAQLLYLEQRQGFGVETCTIDVYDTAGNGYLNTITLQGFRVPVDFAYEISSIDQVIFCTNFDHFTLFDPNDGSMLLNQATGQAGWSEYIWLDKGNLACSEVVIVASWSKQYSVWERNGASLTHAGSYDMNDAAVGLPGGVGSIGPFSGILDYSTCNADGDLFTISYCCVPGGIGRIIRTNDGALVPVGVAYSLETSGRRTSVIFEKQDEHVIVWQYHDNSAPYQIWVADNGRRVYVLVYNNTTARNEIQAYDTFYELYNSTVSPRSGTKTKAQIIADGGFEYFNLVYAKPFVASYALTPNQSNQIRKSGQYKVGIIDNEGVTIIDLRSGLSHHHQNGDWYALPRLGGFDYGSQAFDPSVIYDPDHNAVFYYVLDHGYTDFPGRAFLANPAPATRPTYQIADAYRDLSLLVGYDNDKIDTSSLTDVITGMALNTGVAYADLISDLSAAFRVDVIETPDFGIKFVRRTTGTVDFTIGPSDCVMTDSSDGYLVTVSRVDANQLPNILQLAYVDPDQQYLVGMQNAKRAVYPQVTVQGKTVVQISIPIIMTASQAAYYVGYALFDMWSGAISLAVTCPSRFGIVEVGDVCDITLVTGRVIRAKVVGMQYNSDKTVSFTLSATQVNHFVPQKQITTHFP